MVSQLQIVSTVDLNYFCQVVDGITRAPGAYIRNIEDIFGDMSSINWLENTQGEPAFIYLWKTSFPG